MAQVYMGEHLRFREKVAIKVLREEYVRNGNIRDRFIAEARTLFRLSHPRLLKVTDLIEDGDLVAFVMEYLDGQTLKQYVERKGQLSDAEIKSLLIQMLEGLGYLHASGLVHRDVKPSNFMIDSRETIKILDLGIAKVLDTKFVEYTQTQTVQQMGTPMYMSPEQVLETKSVTHASDLYSLGVVLWQMVIGRKPYDSSSLSDFQLKSKIVHEPLPLTGTAWDETIQRATNKEVGHRFRDCGEWIATLTSDGSFRDSVDQTIVSVGTDPIDLDQEIEEVIFPVVRIGNQEWMSENLNVDRFCNGDMIPQANTEEDWKMAGREKSAAWCYYSNDPQKGEKYGKLYNWYALIDSRRLLPRGWGLPSDADWEDLSKYFGEGRIGRKLKSSIGWKSFLFQSGSGNNESGFSALPGGFREPFGGFSMPSTNGYWWSITEYEHSKAWGRCLSHEDDILFRNSYDKSYGFSVRGIRMIH